MARIKADIQVVNRKGLYYTVARDKRVKRYRPWLGDHLSFLYDWTMSSSVFPRKFGADMQKHYDILTRALAGFHGARVLELAAGSGSAVHFLGSDSRYTGTDISPGLLKRAARRFREAGFSDAEFYVVSADDLPFEDASFDLCLCILSLNFIGNVEQVFQEAGRVLLPGGTFVCSVPVPERNRLQSTIRGTLYSEAALADVSRAQGFEFEPLPHENGALLYFSATKRG